MSTTEERFKSDRTASNRAGFTLMNNQVGYVVANVMRDKPGVTVEVLPSMIRVDGTNKFEIDYAECCGGPLSMTLLANHAPLINQ